jgi:multiple sugar transport system permease protein
VEPAQPQARARVITRETGTREDRIMKRVFLGPTVIIILAMTIFPLLWALGISVTDIQRGGSTTERQARALYGPENAGGHGFLGVFDWSLSSDNYTRVFDDQRLWTVARNTVFYVVVGVSFEYVLAFTLAMVLNQRIIGRRFFRVLFMLPMMMMPVAVGYTGRMLFQSSFSSPIPDLLRRLDTQLEVLPVIGDHINLVVPWIAEGNWARITLMIISTWQWTSFIMIVLLSGMQGIPEDVYEAARVDGANAFQMFWRITFPLMAPLSITVVLIRSLEMFKIIDFIVVVTGGGPGSSTESLTMYVYEKALTAGDYSYASAIAFVFLIIVIVYATLFLSITRRFAPKMS